MLIYFQLGLGERFLSEFGKDIIEEFTSKIRDYAYELGKYLVELSLKLNKLNSAVSGFLERLGRNNVANSHCTAGLNIVDLMPNGDVFPCYMVSYHPETFKMENINDNNFTREFEKVRESLSNEKYKD